MVFLLLESLTSMVFAGAGSVPSRRPNAKAPRIGERTRVCQNRKFDLVSFWDGGDPSVVARVGVKEDDAMEALQVGRQRRLQGQATAVAAGL
jgi:hypothetical protein